MGSAGEIAMIRLIPVAVFATAAWALLATPSLAGNAPAPLLGAGPVGLAVLAVGGAGYAAMRWFRGRKG
jgi:hypothetical protein